MAQPPPNGRKDQGLSLKGSSTPIAGVIRRCNKVEIEAKMLSYKLDAVLGFMSNLHGGTFEEYCNVTLDNLDCGQLGLRKVIDIESQGGTVEGGVDNDGACAVESNLSRNLGAPIPTLMVRPSVSEKSAAATCAASATSGKTSGATSSSVQSGIITPQRKLIPKVIQIPAILDGKYFRIHTRNGRQIVGECQLCPGKDQVKGSIRPNSSFVSHLKSLHPEVMGEYEAYRDKVMSERKKK